MNKIYFFLLLLSFSSCLPRISYLGNSYAPTKEPDFYVDEKTIERPYKIIGKGYSERFTLFPVELLQKKAIEKAKAKGADAVLIQDYFVQTAVANVGSVYRTDSGGRGSVTAGNATLSNGSSLNTGFIILFLKYTDH